MKAQSSTVTKEAEGSNANKAQRKFEPQRPFTDDYRKHIRDEVKSSHGWLWTFKFGQLAHW